MAYTSQTITIGDRKVKIANGTYGGGTTGQTQTFNVYDDTNLEGNYQQVYRIRGHANFIRVSDLGEVSSLQELDTYLIQRGAVREGPRRRR